MLIKSFQFSKCIKGCTLFNDKSNYLYWEGRNVTTDEIEIVNFINSNKTLNNFKLLHVGIGNSYVASNIKNYKEIDGITISNNEIIYANKLNQENYNIHFLNKFTDKGFLSKSLNGYDIIIDVNLKSFSCCNDAFADLFNNYVRMLNKNGKIFTGKKGMNWSRVVKPVVSFSFKNLFHKKLKEFDGKETNLLRMNECLELSRRHNLKFYQDKKSNVVYFEVLG